MLDASPVAEGYGIVLGYGYIFLQTYMPFIVATPYLFLSALPEKIEKSKVQSWGQGNKLQ